MMGKGEGWRVLELPSFLDTKTDENGRFLFANMPAEATFEFRVRKLGRVTVDTLTQATFGDSSATSNVAQTDSGEIRLQFSPGQPGIRLTLPLEARIEGVVVEKISSTPVAGVKVTAGFDQFEEGFLPPDPVTTAEDGTFSIGGLIAGRRTLQLAMTRGQAAEWAAEPVEISLGAAETRSGVRLELTRGGVIEVLVKNSEGRPVGQAGLRVCRVERDRWFRGVTDEKGLARMRIPSGQYRVAAPIKPGYALQTKEEQVSIGEGETKRVEFVLEAAPGETGGNWGRTLFYDKARIDTHNTCVWRVSMESGGSAGGRRGVASSYII